MVLIPAAGSANCSGQYCEYLKISLVFFFEFGSLEFFLDFRLSTDIMWLHCPNFVKKSMPKVFESNAENRRPAEVPDQHGAEHRSLTAKLRRIMVIIAHKAGWLSTVDPDIVRGYLSNRRVKAQTIIEDGKSNVRVESTPQKRMNENC